MVHEINWNHKYLHMLHIAVMLESQKCFLLHLFTDVQASNFAASTVEF